MTDLCQCVENLIRQEATGQPVRHLDELDPQLLNDYCAALVKLPTSINTTTPPVRQRNP